MKDHEERIVDLERENRDLRARLDALQLLLGNKTTQPRCDEQQGVRITRPLAKVALPTDDECRRLCEVVWGRYPRLRPARNEEAEFVAGFKAAFQFVQHHGRRAEPDHERGLGWWVDTARDWISQHRISGLPIGGAALVVAIIAAGDVPYTDPEAPGFACALQFGGGGLPSKDWWRRALAGTLLDPVLSPYPKAVASPARVQQMAVGWRK